jgi:hypothetical protein
LTPDVQRVIVESVAAGVPRKYAAMRAGVTERAVYLWLSRGKRESKGEYYSFYSALKKAEADAVAVRVARIARAGQGGQVVERTTVTTTNAKGETTTRTAEKLAPGQWTADAWLLERRHEEFAANRREIKELRAQLAALVKAVEDGRLAATPAAGAPAPRVGGDADPKSV